MLPDQLNSNWGIYIASPTSRGVYREGEVDTTCVQFGSIQSNEISRAQVTSLTSSVY